MTPRAALSAVAEVDTRALVPTRPAVPAIRLEIGALAGAAVRRAEGGDHVAGRNGDEMGR